MYRVTTGSTQGSVLCRVPAGGVRVAAGGFSNAFLWCLFPTPCYPLACHSLPQARALPEEKKQSVDVFVGFEVLNDADYLK